MLSKTYPSSALLKPLMNTLQLHLDMVFSHTFHTHPIMIFSSMHVSGIIPPTLQPPQGEEMCIQLLEHKITPTLMSPMKRSSPKALIHLQMISTNQVHQTKQGKPPHKPLSGFPKDQYRKPSLSTPKKSPKKYDGPVYVPAEVYKLLSPEAIVALNKYNTEAINRFAKKRGVHVTDMIDPESPPPEDTTHEGEAQSVPHQFDDAPESEMTQFWTTSTANITRMKT